MDIGKRTNEAVIKAAADVEELFDLKAIDEAVYCKCMVSLAFEFSENQELDACMQLLHRCTPAYYKEPLNTQMTEDGMFRDCVIRMVYNLIRAGYIEFEKDPLELLTPTARA